MTNANHGAGFAVLLIAMLAVGCGGGGGSATTAGIDRGGITIAVGPVTGFGSIFVNGVEYSTSGASISVDDQPGTESELRVGQIVRVEATVDASGTKGSATKIDYNDQLEGPVQGIDLASSRMVVLGQTVQVGAGTSFDSRIVPRGLDGLLIGDRVEVSGTVASDGVVNATRIERKAASSSVEVKGTVASLDTNAKRFVLGQLQVDYSTAQLNEFSGGQPANGDTVEAVGTLNGSGTLVASRVDKEGTGSPGTSKDKADFEGLITRFVSSTDFDVAGQRVTTTASTTYNGGTAANLALDVQVEVEGAFDTSGRIVATKVDFRRDGNVEFNATVESVNVAGNSLVVLGITVRTNSLTRFEDQSSAQVQRFSLTDLTVGDFVEIRAYDDGSGLLATLLEREDAQSRIDLEGPATSVAQPNFTVAGVAVTTDANTEFRDKSGVTVTASAFFAAASGHTVKVRGTLVGNTVLAERAELED
jgi:hypothetical protein